MLSEKKVNLKKIKYLGGIGAIIAMVGNSFPVLLVLGLILVLMAVYELSLCFKNKKIFDYFLINFVIKIGIIALLIALVFIWWGNLIFNHFSEEIADWFFSLGMSITPSLILMFFLLILGKYFLKKSFEIIAEKTKIDLFKTAGNFHFISAILYIILVGFLIEIIAWVLTIIAFFSLPDEISVENK